MEDTDEISFMIRPVRQANPHPYHTWFDIPDGYGPEAYLPTGIEGHVITDAEFFAVEIEGIRVEISSEMMGEQLSFPEGIPEEQALRIGTAIGRRLAQATGQGAWIPEYVIYIEP